MRGKVVAAVAAWLALAPIAAEAKLFRYAFQGDLNSLDPYSLYESFTIGALGNVYEGLTKRDKDLKIIPGLAERWEMVEPSRWRFYLRKGVKFHNGDDFTADDVVFSAQRVRGPTSDLKHFIAQGTNVVKIDPHTVEFQLPAPNPILHYEWHNWYMYPKKWAEENGATEAQSARSRSLGAFALKANGTGPFMLVSHEPGVRTAFKPNPNWWDKPEHNLTEVVFTTVKSDPTRVAALLTGELDLIEPVPVQDVARVNAAPTTRVLTGPELRTIFLNMDQMRDELLYSSVKGKNPFKDVRVRKAFYQAIDVEAIKTKVMRGMAVPSSLIISPLVFPHADELRRYAYDVAAARTLMQEAGYGAGFDLEMDCPNDRYVNDEAICQAVAQMLARINVRIRLNALPKARYFEKAGPAGKYDSSFNLLGWTPTSLDSWNVLYNIVGCRDADGNGAKFNFGGYCNREIDALAAKILVEADVAARDDMIAKAFRIVHDEVGFIPLHQQVLSWGVGRNISIPQRADDHVLFYWARKD